MQPIVHTVSDHLTLHTLRDTRFKSELLSLHYLVPFVPREASLYYMLPQVLQSGSAHYPTEQMIARKLEELYGADILHRIVRRGNMIEIVFTLDMLSADYTLDKSDPWERGTAILYDLIYCPLFVSGAFCRDTVKREATELSRNIRDARSYKDILALDTARKLVCGDAPYGKPLTGTSKEAKAATPEALTRVYHDFIRQAHVHVWYTGSRAEQTVLAFAQQIALLHAGAPLQEPNAAPLLPPLTRVRKRTETASAKQSQLVLAYRLPLSAGSLDWETASLFSGVLSSSPLARLFRGVREQQSLCYSCNADLDTAAGILYIMAGVEPGKEEVTAAAIRNVVQGLAHSEVTDEELASAKNTVRHYLLSAADAQATYEDFYFNMLFRGRIPDVPAILSNIEKLTKAEILDFAGSFREAAQVVIAGGGGQND